MDEEKGREQEGKGKSEPLDLGLLEGMSGGSGLNNSVTTDTHDMPQGTTK